MAEKKPEVSKKPTQKRSMPENKFSKKMAVEQYEPDEKEKASIREEILLVVTGLISLLLILSYFNLCGPLGTAINYIIFGLVGIFAYIFPFVLFFLVAFSLSNRGNRLAKKKLIFGMFLMLFVTALLQMILGFYEEVGYFQYFEHSLRTYEGEFKTYGGLLGGLLCKLLVSLTGKVATIFILLALLVIFSMLLSGKALFAWLKQTSAVRTRQEEPMEAEVPLVKKETGKRPFRLQPPKEKEEEIPLIKEDTFVEKLKKRTEVEEREEMQVGTAPVVVPITGSYVRDMEEIFPVEPETLEKAEEISPKNKSLEHLQPEESKIEEVKPREEKKESAVVVESIVTASQESLEIPKNTLLEKEHIFPSIDLLSKPKKGASGMSAAALQETANKLQHTLESFGVRVSITNISCGPTVTRYELQPEEGVKVSKITGLSDDIKLNLAAADIRIEAPIPGKAAVGIEVPNKETVAVMLREILDSKEFKTPTSNLTFAVGKDIGGQVIVTDIGKMPHLLIAGATGSGKSVCINTLVMSILYKAKPSDVRLIMIDPKVVELSVYNGIPHLMIPVVTDPKKASAALNWAVVEMTDRYKKFAELSVRDIHGYNEKIKEMAYETDDQVCEKLPQIVIIVDELADLMMVAPGEVEDAICRLAQMARAAGLHLIIATQRPSVNVITGLIKANVPSRIAFAVSSFTDSRTILDGSGAEKLLGKGDMLFFPSGYPKPVRLQGAFVSDKEVSSVVEFLKSQNEVAMYDETVSNQIANTKTEEEGTKGSSEFDEYFAEAGRFIIEKEKASIGMLQRVYKIGFNRAARIMDQLSEAGVVGPEEGTKPRKILMSLEEFESYVEEMV